MNTAELNKVLAQAEIEKVSYKPIRSRRYNVEIVRDGKVVETIYYLANMAKARETAAEYRKTGARCNIIEDVTYNNEWEEIKFIQQPSVDIPTGLMSFETPEMTPNRIKIKRANESQKIQNAAAKKTNGQTRRIMDPEHVPGTESYKMYLAYVKREGYTVKERFNGTVIFMGTQKETSEFLYNLSKTRNLKDLEVIFNGK